MFDIGFGELLLVMVIGLVVLGPERLPVAVRTVASWIRTLRSLASTVQNELSQELKLQELQESLKKVEKASLQNLSPELKASMDELKEAAEAMKRSYSKSPTDVEGANPSTNQPLSDPEAVHDGVIDVERASPSASENTASPNLDQPEVLAQQDTAENNIFKNNILEKKGVENESQAIPATESKSKPEQLSAVSPHQKSDDR